MTDDSSKVVPPVHAATFVPSFSEAARCLGMAQAQGKRHAIAHWQGIVDAHETAAKAALRLESATAPVEVGGAKPIAEVTEGFSDAFGGAAPVARWMGKAPSLGTTLYSHDDYATLARQLAEQRDYADKAAQRVIAAEIKQAAAESALAAARQELAQERALSTAISNDCNAVANERNALRDQLAAATRRVAEVEGLLNRAHEWLFSYGLAGTLRGEIEDALQKEPK